MGCLKQIVVQIGCLVVLAVLVVCLFVYRDQVAALYRRVRHLPPHETTRFVPPVQRDAGTAKDALDRLSRPGGPAYVDLSAGQVAALIRERLGSAEPRRSVDSIQVAFVNDEARVRGIVDLSQVPRSALGPLAGALDRRQPVTLGGAFAADSAGRLLWTVNSLTVGDFPFPKSTIGALLRSLRVRDVEGRTVRLPLDHRIGDASVRQGSLRLYRFER